MYAFIQLIVLHPYFDKEDWSACTLRHFFTIPSFVEDALITSKRHKSRDCPQRWVGTVNNKNDVI